MNIVFVYFGKPFVKVRVRVMVTVRLLRVWMREGKVERDIQRRGFINNRNKLSVYRTPCRLCACMQ